jgi:hypothetical protein
VPLAHLGTCRAGEPRRRRPRPDKQPLYATASAICGSEGGSSRRQTAPLHTTQTKKNPRDSAGSNSQSSNHHPRVGGSSPSSGMRSACNADAFRAGGTRGIIPRVPVPERRAAAACRIPPVRGRAPCGIEPAAARARRRRRPSGARPEASTPVPATGHRARRLPAPLNCEGGRPAHSETLSRAARP